MTDDTPNHETTEQTQSGAPDYANWPIEGGAEDVRYLGFAAVDESGTPMLYRAADHAVYEGQLDEANERIAVDEESAREFDEGTTVSDVVEAIADEIGWTSLADWARDRDETAPGQVAHVEFHTRNVRDSAAHDDAFFGSYTVTDATGRVHTVERRFRVYTDGDRREHDALVVVTETHLVAEAPQEDRRAGDAEEVSQTTIELHPELEVDVETALETGRLQEWCRDWHEAHLDHPTA